MIIGNVVLRRERRESVAAIVKRGGARRIISIRHLATPGKT